MKMKETAKEAARQRKIYMILIIILIIVLTVLGGGYYFMMQTKAASQKTSGKNSDDQSRTSQTSGSDTLEYKGGTYKFSIHPVKVSESQQTTSIYSMHLVMASKKAVN